MKNLNTVFPFYETLAEQNISKEYVDSDCALVGAQNLLIPFILIRPELTDLSTVTLEIYNSLDDSLVQTLTPTNYLTLQPSGDFDYLYYNDTLLASNLDTDNHYYIKCFTGATTYYSERFAVKKDLSDYLYLKYYNLSKLNNILLGFEQKLYINAVLKTPKYVRTDEATEKDAINIYQSQILQKANVITYLNAPEFIIDSLMTLPMMDSVTLLAQNGDSIEIQQIEVTDPEWTAENKGATALFTIELIEYTIIKKLNFTEMGCPEAVTTNIRQGVTTLTKDIEATITFSSVLPANYTIDGRAQDASGNTVLITIPPADITTSGFKVTGHDDCTFRWTAIKE